MRWTAFCRFCLRDIEVIGDQDEYDQGEFNEHDEWNHHVHRIDPVSEWCLECGAVFDTAH
jgi:hypothetical protein